MKKNSVSIIATIVLILFNVQYTNTFCVLDGGCSADHICSWGKCVSGCRGDVNCKKGQTCIYCPKNISCGSPTRKICAKKESLEQCIKSRWIGDLTPIVGVSGATSIVLCLIGTVMFLATQPEAWEISPAILAAGLGICTLTVTVSTALVAEVFDTLIGVLGGCFAEALTK